MHQGQCPFSQRSSGAVPITESTLGQRLIRLMAEGLLGVCDMLQSRYPETLQEFEASLVEPSRRTGVQAGLSFAHRPSHREFYELLGMDPNLAGTPHEELREMAERDPSIARGLRLVYAFATAVDPEDRQSLLQLNAKTFREVGGPEFELIAEAFAKGDCQRDLVFCEMQQILLDRRGSDSRNSI